MNAVAHTTSLLNNVIRQIFNLNKLDTKEKNAFSNTYDLTIKKGTKTISQFKDGITLTFNVNPDRAKNPNNLKVFYFDEETGKWKNIGGTYSNGTVTVVTTHFSKFAVFEAEDDKEGNNNIVDIDDESTT